MLVASGWQEVPGFGEARLVSLEVDALPDGMPRSAWATARGARRRRAGRPRRRSATTRRSRAAAARGSRCSPTSAACASRASSRGRTAARSPSAARAASAARRWRSSRFGPARAARPPRSSARAGRRAGTRRAWLAQDGELALAGGRPLQLAGDRASSPPSCCAPAARPATRGRSPRRSCSPPASRSSGGSSSRAPGLEARFRPRAIARMGALTLAVSRLVSVPFSPACSQPWRARASMAPVVGAPSDRPLRRRS